MSTLLLLATLGALVAQEPESQPTSAPTSAPTATTEAEERALVIRGADVHVGDGRVLRRADIVIRGSKIEEVGRDLRLPEDADTIDATGRVVAPGIVVPQASGFGAPNPFGLEEIADAVNPYDPSIKLGLAVGITAFGMIANPGRDTPRGKSAVLKLAPGDVEGMVCRTNTFVSMSVPLDPKQWKSLRELVEKAREHAAKVAALKKDEKPPKAPGDVEGMLKLLDGEQKLWIQSRGGPFDGDMTRDALAIAELLGQGVVLDRPTTAWTTADAIAATGSLVILAPRQRVPADPARPDDTGTNIASAAILARAGVPVAVVPPRTVLSLDGLLGQDLNTPTLPAAFAVRGGLDNRKALRTITLDAARALGVEARIGSVEAGKDADLLILDGDPLHYRTLVETTLVNGKVVYERQKEPFYRHLQR